MSLFVIATATCSTCQAAEQLKLAASVNADNRPDLREALLDGTFQALVCASCGANMRLPPHLSYLDMGRGQWILTDGIDRLPEWRVVEAGAQSVFEQTYGAGASAMAQELGAALRPRIVFGWPAMREKLLCHALGLDDVTLELLKLAMLRAIPDPPYDDTHELRLIGADESALQMAWVEGASEVELAAVSVDRAVYDNIVSDPAPWGTLRAGVAAGLFVDCRRLFLA